VPGVVSDGEARNVTRTPSNPVALPRFSEHAPLSHRVKVYHAHSIHRAPYEDRGRRLETPGPGLRGLLEGQKIGTHVTLIRYVTDVVGEGPKLHIHPYDELLTITEGRARCTVGDQTIDAGPGDIVFGPANIPHGYQNLGPGMLDSLDIHLSPQWIQFDLADAWSQSGILISAESKV